MNNKVSISIGIPAYNEEANIAQLLRRLLTQKLKTCTLREIIVVSDCSTDATEEIIRSINDKRIRLIVNETRQGQAFSQNTIKEQQTGDILIMLNADVLPERDTFIEAIIAPFRQGTHVGLVCPRLVHMPARHWFDRIINYSVDLKTALYESWRNGDNMYTCRGTARAFSKEFLKTFHWPRIAAEDAYTYFKAKEQGFRYIYRKDATLLFRSPSTFTDHRRQSRRFFANFAEMKQYFPPQIIAREYAIPRSTVFRITLSFALRNPFFFLLYATVVLSIYLFPGKKSDPLWVPAQSTKRLIQI